MNLSVGIVGLPNVGKSTLFNALLKKQQALAANYPFATIEPNVGVVPVPDERLQKLAEIVATSEHSENSAKSATQTFRQSDTSDALSRSEFSGKLPPLKPATVSFVDIAGLVKGASEGAGLGNKFLSHIREVSVIAHVVRAFEDPDVVRHESTVDPRQPAPDALGNGGLAKSDYETIQTELMLADLQSAQNQESKVKNNDPLKPMLRKIIDGLNKDISVREMDFTFEEREQVSNIFFLTIKPEIIVLNVSEEDYNGEKIERLLVEWSSQLDYESKKIIVICAKVESDLAALSEEEQREYLADLGLRESGLERLIKKAYETLGLISFLTAGEKEVRAWTIKKGTDAQHAAGEIHTDFMKKFIKAEVISFDDYVRVGGRKKARELGKARLEGKDHIVQDGDVIEFKIGS